MHRDTCGRLIKQIHDAIDKHVNNELHQKNLTLAQARVLIELDEDYGCAKPLKELERCFHVAQPTVVGLVRRLEEKGFVEGFIDPKDNRVKLVKLTLEGEKFLETTKLEIEEIEKQLLTNLTQAEQQNLLRALSTVYDNIK